MPQMYHVPNSTMIREIGHDVTTRDLHVKFSNGDMHVFHNVSPHVFEGLKTAGSVGKYFHKYVKSRYSSTKQPVAP